MCGFIENSGFTCCKLSNSIICIENNPNVYDGKKLPQSHHAHSNCVYTGCWQYKHKHRTGIDNKFPDK